MLLNHRLVVLSMVLPRAGEGFQPLCFGGERRRGMGDLIGEEVSVRMDQHKQSGTTLCE